MPLPSERSSLLPAACLLAFCRGVSWGSPWPHALDILQPSLAGLGLPLSKSLGVCFVPGFVGCGLGCFGGWLLFVLFLALHETYSVKFCILLQGPVEPNLKSVENVCGPVLFSHRTLDTFLKVASYGPNEYWKTHCKMQASELESCLKKKKRANLKRSYTV